MRETGVGQFSYIYEFETKSTGMGFSARKLSADRVKRVRVGDEPLPIKKTNQAVATVRRSTRQRSKPK